MAFVSSNFGNSVYGNYAQSWGQAAASAAPTFAPPSPSPYEMVAYLQAALASLAQMQQGWGGFAAAPVTAPPVSAAQAGNAGNAGNGGGLLGGGGKGKGLLGTGMLAGLFGAGSPILGLVHSVLDPIPLVGDIARMVCSVVSPDYHAAKEEAPAPNASLAVAVSASSAYGGTLAQPPVQFGGALGASGGAYG